jgi:hypothetical protein
MKPSRLLACVTFAATIALAAPLHAQTQVPINTDLQNTSVPIAVVAFCNATSAPKDLEARIGQSSPGRLIASLSGTQRQAVTFLVPSWWHYRIAVAVPPGGSCQATIWSVAQAKAITFQSVPLNAQQQNTSAEPIVVTAICNATGTEKALEGWVGPQTASGLIASLSGTDRQTITVVVPPQWFYKVSVVVPSGGTCTARRTST